MTRMSRSKPSPAVAVLAVLLAVGVAASAVAGSGTLQAKLTVTDVKQIAKKQIKKAEPDLSVAEARQATEATHAAEATHAGEATHAAQADQAAAAATASNAEQLGGQPPSAYATSTVEPFHEVGAAGEPGFESSWGNKDPNGNTTAAFYKDPYGVVHLKGTITGGLSNTVAFTLPAGYRPAKAAWFSAALTGAGGIARVTILSSGVVQPQCDPGCASRDLGLDGLTFRAGS